MDWAKTKITSADFEQGTIGEDRTQTWDNLKYPSSNRIRTKSLIPVSKAVNIPVVSGYEYCFAMFDGSQTYLGATTGFHTWDSLPQNIVLPSGVAYIGILLMANNSATITPAVADSALPGYIWTAGQPETGMLANGDRYTKGRNLLMGSKDFPGNPHVQSEKFGNSAVIGSTAITSKYFVLALFSDLPLGQHTSQWFTFCFWAKGNVYLRAFFYGPPPDYTRVAEIHASNGYTGWSSDGSVTFPLTSDWQFYWVKWKLADKPGPALKKHCLLRVDDLGSGSSAFVAKPILIFGDEPYPWTSAPEDEPNPTEAV